MSSPNLKFTGMFRLVKFRHFPNDRLYSKYRIDMSFTIQTYPKSQKICWASPPPLLAKRDFYVIAYVIECMGRGNNQKEEQERSLVTSPTNLLE